MLMWQYFCNWEYTRNRQYKYRYMFEMSLIVVNLREDEAGNADELVSAQVISLPFSYAHVFLDGDRIVRIVPMESLKANTLYKITLSESLGGRRGTIDEPINDSKGLFNQFFGEDIPR